MSPRLALFAALLLAAPASAQQGSLEFRAIDKDTGQLATPACPRVFREAFLTGTEPHQSCQTHGGRSILDEVGGFFRRILP